MEFGDFQVGDHVWFERRFTPDDFASFSRLSGDRNPLHHDPDFAARSSLGQTIVPLHLAAAPLSFVAGMVFPGESSLYLGHTLKAVSPVAYDVPVVYSARIVELSPAHRVLGLRVIGLQGEQVVLDASMQVRAITPEWTSPAAGPARRASEQNCVVLTGAAGEIGRSTAARLAHQGFNLVLVVRGSTPALDETASACRQAGAQVDVVHADLAVPQDRLRICEVLKGRDDVMALVHAASPPVAATIDSHVRVNFEALVELARALLPGFLRRQQGRVVAVGSSSVEVGLPGWEAYSGAKAMVSQFLHTLDRKYRPYGITCQVIAPTRVDTAMSRSLGAPGGALLVPEEVASCIAGSLGGPADDATYLALSPSGVRRAYYGVFTTPSAPSPAGEAAGQPARPREHPGPAVPAEPGPAGLDATLRQALALPASTPLEDGGLGLTPGWDSLKHIELMLALERAYGISLSASDMDRMSTYAGLRQVLQAKLRMS